MTWPRSTDGEAAINVLGQPNFTTSSSDVTAEGNSPNPSGLAIDDTGEALLYRTLIIVGS
jgi:hypothetical protein